MSQPQRTKHPLDVLQSMINGILIETGRALRSSDKEGGRTLANASSRLRSTIPSAIENFHQALDELECDILRAKSVLWRDLEELRAKRYAIENPVPLVEEVEPIPEPELDREAIVLDAAEQSTIKEEDSSAKSPKKEISGEMSQAESSQDPSKEDTLRSAEELKEQQGPTPPASNDTDFKPIGLGINTDGPAEYTAPVTVEAQNSSIDSLFDANDNTGDSDLNFENMDFSFPDSTQDPSQLQTTDFDLDNFGTTQDFNMTDIQTDSNTVNNTNNKETEDLFGLGNTGDIMDVDLVDLDMAGAENSMFDEMFNFGDDAGLSGGGEMEHGEFDSAFFGVDND